jgi:peptidoglycan hydrolase-like protein with peptidoglycan-binding domain
LAAVGHDPGPADGLWGPRTQAAVVAFQSAHGLAPDGIIGPLTLRQLDQADATAGGGGGGATPPTPEPVEPTPKPAEPPPGGESTTGGGGGSTSTEGGTAFGEMLGLAGAPDQGLITRLARALGIPPNVVAAAGPAADTVAPLVGALEGAGTTGTEQEPGAAPPAAEPGGTPPIDLGQTIALLQQFSLALQAAAAAGTVPADAAQLAQTRIDAIVRFLQSQAALPAGEQVSSQRMAVVATALSQIGAARANEAGEVDPADAQGRRFRKGHEALLDYFTTAFGSLDQNQLINVKYHGTKLQSWCGIFALWAYKKNGAAASVTWQTGGLLANPPHAGMRSVAARLVDLKTSPVKPGDIGLLADHQHHFMVVAVNGNDLDTIEGNSNSAGDPTGGQVSTGRRSISTTFNAGFGFQRPVDLP